MDERRTGHTLHFTPFSSTKSRTAIRWFPPLSQTSCQVGTNVLVLVGRRLDPPATVSTKVSARCLFPQCENRTRPPTCRASRRGKSFRQQALWHPSFVVPDPGARPEASSCNARAG